MVQTLIHGRYFFFYVKETVFSVLWVKIVAEHLIIRCAWLTQFCFCSQCGGSSVGLTVSWYRQAGLSIRDALSVFVAYYFYQIVVNSWPDFQLQCRKMRHEPPLCINVDAGFRPDYYFFFFCGRFERFSLSRSLSLCRNPRHMVGWGITTFAASIFEETVASSCRKLYFISGIIINRER